MSKKQISIFFILLLLLLMVVFLVQVSKRYKRISEYNHYIYTIEELRSTNVHLNSQINKSLTVLNLDYIVEDCKKISKLISQLDNKNFYYLFGKDLKSEIRDIKRDFQLKFKLVERFKTYNATIVGSVPYMFDLAQVFKEESKPTLLELRKLGVSVTDVFKTFMGVKLGKKVLDRDMKNLKELQKKYKTKSLKFLSMNIKETLHYLKLLNATINDYRKIDIDSKLKKLLIIIEKKFQLNMKTQNTVIMILLILLLFLMMVFIYIYLKLIKTNQELFSFKLAVESSDNIIVITDTKKNIMYVNEAFENVTGYTKEEAYGKNPRILKSNILSKDFYKDMYDVLNSGNTWCGEFINKNKLGNVYYEKASIIPLYSENKHEGYLAIKLDITEYIEQKKRVDYLAHHDTLTKLPNRRFFEKEINDNVERYRSNKEVFTILFLDLDGFKFINDTLGHDIGDEVLKYISKRIEHCIGKEDKIFRVGGDEFSIILKKVSEKGEIDAIATRLIENINKPINTKGFIVNVSVSIGIAIYPKDAFDAISLLKHADTAMYKAKIDGKNRFVYYSKKYSEELLKNINLEKALKSALKNGEFYLVYQPKFKLDTKEVVSVETLLRWSNEEFKTVSPEIFIPIAERVGLMRELGEFVFKRACEDFLNLKRKFPSLKLITVNVSSTQLLDLSISENFYKIVKEIDGIKCENIGIEITETYIMKDIKLSNLILSKMSLQGFKILMDDFGTGYSSMIYLKELPIDILKIDKSFIENICNNESDLKIVKAIVAMAKSFNFEIVAEGIETKEQERLLKDLDVDIAQGYLFCEPKRVEEL